MKPALTAEEWRVVLREGAWQCDDWVFVKDEPYHISLDDHMKAAVLLHGQPFGFSREDVEALRMDVDMCAPFVEVHDEDALNSIADRIEALLPPEDV